MGQHQDFSGEPLQSACKGKNLFCDTQVRGEWEQRQRVIEVLTSASRN